MVLRRKAATGTADRDPPWGSSRGLSAYARNDVANRFRKLGKLPPETGFSAEIQTERAFDRLEIVPSTRRQSFPAGSPPASAGIGSLQRGRTCASSRELDHSLPERRELFRQCLQGIRGQDYPADVQLLIIDSGSNDGPICWLRVLEPRSSGSRRAISIIENAADGLAHARHNFVAYLVQDAIPEDDTWLQNMVRALLRNPAAGRMLRSSGTTLRCRSVCPL